MCCLGCEVVDAPVLGYNCAFPFSILMCFIIIWKYKCDFISGFPIFRKHSHQENEGLVAQEIPCVADAAQCLVELAGSVRIDPDVSLELSGAFFLDHVAGIGENNRLNSTLQRMDEVDNLLCIRGEIPADGFCIHDGPSHVDLLFAAHHRNNIGSTIIRIGQML